jgi:type IV pilus assembly protein PilM
MFRFGRSKAQPIGLDIGHDSIKMLQVEVQGESLSVVAAAREQFSGEARTRPEARLSAATDMVRRMLRKNPFVGRRVVAALPSSMIHVKNFRLPSMPAEELQSAVSFEARHILSFDPDEAQVRFLSAGEVRQGNDVLQEVIVVAARNSEISGFVEQLHGCGVLIDALDVEACALYRSIERFIRRREDEQEVQVLVDVGFRGTEVVIGRGRDVSFLKSIEIGGTHLNEAVSRRLNITIEEAAALRRRLSESPDASPDKRDPVRQAVFDAGRCVMEQLGRELSLCLRYQSVTFRGHRPARVRLLGGEGADAQLHGVLSSILTVPVEACRPLYSVDTQHMNASDRQGTMGSWALALGLALRRTEGRFRPKDGKPRDPAGLRSEVPNLEKLESNPTDAAAPVRSGTPLSTPEPAAAFRGATGSTAGQIDPAGTLHAAGPQEAARA